jgi:ketosteroid isomerase-like protein
MSDVANPREADRQFFTALISADVAALDRLLADDFILIDVMSGSEVTKSSLLAVITSGQLRFEAVEPVESLVRLYQTTAVITGRTQMRGRFAEQPFSVSSRYTHVFVEQQGQWRLVTAQGTQVSDPPGQTAA